MSNIATTISQSRKLIELGLDQNTANMYYPYFGAGQYGDIPRVGLPIEYSGGKDIPAWSLSALLEVIPRDSALYKIENTYSMHHGWTTENHANPIDAAYEMVCYLLEQGLIKKGGEE